MISIALRGGVADSRAALPLLIRISETATGIQRTSAVAAQASGPMAAHRSAAPFHSSHFPAMAVDPEGAKQRVSKVKRKDKKSPKRGGGDRNAEKTKELLIRALDAKDPIPPPASDEEMARRAEVGRQYSIGMMRRHNDLNHDHSCKIKMKMHAVNMLPKGTMWGEEAMKIDDDNGPPLTRKMPTWTPPIEGFKVDDWIAEDDDDM